MGVEWQSMNSTRILVLASAFIGALSAQWINHPDAATPRTADGKPNLAAPAPHKGGKPDLSGIWRIARPRTIPAAEGSYASLQYWMASGETISMLPWAEALFKQRLASFGAGRPSERCLPHAIPDAMIVGNFKIVQDPGLFLILYEEFARFRQIFTDGRTLPAEMSPAWFGYSIGRWDGDALVVDSKGFNDLSWLDDAGHPHTEAMHTIERFRRRDFGHMEIQLTVDDPKAYIKPWTLTMQFQIMPDTELIEDVCENEKDAQHAVLK
jgi:hypothetical protein